MPNRVLFSRYNGIPKFIPSVKLCPSILVLISFASVIAVPVQAQSPGFAVFRPSNDIWYSANPTAQRAWGQPGDVPIVGDFDGDGQTDYAIYRSSDNSWWIIPSSTGEAYETQWGEADDIPVPGDYDGDGKTDLAVWRPSNQTWYIIYSSTGESYSQPWGQPGDQPLMGVDFDGDGKTDLAVWRPSNQTWYIFESSTGQLYSQAWGEPNDLPVLGDFDGDGKTDLAIYRSSDNSWWIYPSSTGQSYERQWGEPGDITIPGDYDGDGKTDFAVFRPSNGTWYIVPSSTSQAYNVQLGQNGDTPVFPAPGSGIRTSNPTGGSGSGTTQEISQPDPVSDPPPAQPIVGSGSAQACSNITGNWADNLSGGNWSLTQTGNSVSGSLTGTVPVQGCNNVTWQVTGQISGNSATLTATNPNPPIQSCQSGAIDTAANPLIANVTFSCSSGVADETSTVPSYVGSFGIIVPQQTQSATGGTWTRTTSVPSVAITSADIVNDVIGITLSGQGLTDTLVLKLNGTTNGNSPSPITINLDQDRKGAGSYTYHFGRTSLQPGQYSLVTATWAGATANATIGFKVLGYTRFSQYNTPYENTCGGAKSVAYVFTTYKYNPDPSGETPLCHWEQTSLNAQFSSQVFTNGTGVSASNQVLKSFPAIGMCGLPPGATKFNTFFVVNPKTGITGSCNGTPQQASSSNSGTVAVSPPPGSAEDWSCSDQVLLINTNNQNDPSDAHSPQGLKRIKDTCPGCSGGFGSDWGNTIGHIDTYNALHACTAKSIGNDYGNYYTIRLR